MAQPPTLAMARTLTRSLTRSLTRRLTRTLVCTHARVCIYGQTSPERLWMVEPLSQRWGGAISLALYLPGRGEKKARDYMYTQLTSYSFLSCTVHRTPCIILLTSPASYLTSNLTSYLHI